ncbi:hypothetical protein HanRHA438_Chr05g0231101 [Helianthus annuus]|nr:hypothetical protein HanRHA438_Chr05g0231101 [Helianthus annuus]
MCEKNSPIIIHTAHDVTHAACINIMVLMMCQYNTSYDQRCVIRMSVVFLFRKLKTIKIWVPVLRRIPDNYLGATGRLAGVLS